MASSPSIFELEPLLQPIPGDKPVGVDPRDDPSSNSPYYKIKDARTAARDIERKGEDRAPDWARVIDLGLDILAGQAKDLEVAVWMIEGLAREQGFAGLRDGFNLVTGLVENFWDGIYPLPDEEGVVTTVAPITGLNGEGQDGALIQPIRLIPITAGSEDAYNLWHYEQALDLEKVTDAARKQKRIDGGAIPMAKFTASIASTPGGFFLDLADDLTGAKEAFARMTAALDKAAGIDSPPSGRIRDIIDKVLEAVRYFARDKLALAASAAESAAAASAAAEPVAEAAVEGTVVAGSAQVVMVKREGYGNREEALVELMKISAYFRKTEPHSPLSYTLEEAVRRGRMSLPELLAELITDQGVRTQFLVSVGVKPE